MLLPGCGKWKKRLHENRRKVIEIAIIFILSVLLALPSLLSELKSEGTGAGDGTNAAGTRK